jgi:flagellar biosynthesis/type III secretory pathway protein FliH
MGKQIFDRKKNILTISLLVLFVISLTTSSVKAVPLNASTSTTNNTNHARIEIESSYVSTENKAGSGEGRDIARESGYRRGYNAGINAGILDGEADYRQHSNSNYFKNYNDKAPINFYCSQGSRTYCIDYETGYSNGYNVGYNAGYDGIFANKGQIRR